MTIWKKRLFWLVKLTLALTFCAAAFAAEDQEILAKIEPEAIASRIAELRMGDLVIKARRGSTIKIKQVKHEFLWGYRNPQQLGRELDRSDDAGTAAEVHGSLEGELQLRRA